MDATREHLWGQLLREQNLVESSRLQQIVAERDQRLRSGQDCSIGQLLVQKRVLDPQRFHSLHSEIEGRGRACYSCRRVFLATGPNDNLNCPSCGGSSRLPPPQSGRFPAAGSDRHPAAPAAGSGRFPVPAGSGRFPAPAGSGAHPMGSGRFGPAASGHYTSGSTLRPNYFQAPGSGPHGAVGGPITPPGTGAYNPAGSGGYSPTGSYAPVSGGFNPVEGGYPRPATTASADDEFSSSGDLLDSGELGIGKRFGNYEITDELGRGGMGVVYKAIPVGQPNKPVAIKVLLAGEFASEKLKKRFKAEAELSNKLDHPNIVPVFDVGEVDGLLYYSMGYVEGQELQDMIRAKSLPIRRGVEILVEVARAAHHAHQHGVVHRDLKPSNVLIASDGTPYIMDFGLAKNLEADKGMTKSGVAIGTPYYMPPEQARGSHREMDARSDVYALGAILYEIATRRVPFTAKTQNELLRKIVEEEPPTLRSVRAGVAADLETITLKCLSKDKSDRYDSADDLAEDLERFLAGEPIRARRPAFYKPILRKIKRNRTQSVVVGVAVVAVVAAAGIIGVLHSNYQERIAIEEKKKKEDEAARKKKEEEEAKQRAIEEARLAKENELRQKGERAIRSGMGSYSASRSATSYSELLRALERADDAFTEALRIDGELGLQADPSTAYRRGLVRRLRCSWKTALEDFLLAGKSPSHQARGHLAAGLIQLRQLGDKAAARKSLEAAVVATGVSDLDENEEHTAAGVASAYLAFLRDDYQGSRSKLTALISQGGLGGLAGEANGALAYIERVSGKPLGGDVHVTRGLRSADKALATNKYRYAFLVDRSLLRARAGKSADALQDQRSARNLDVDGPWAEVADAQVNAMPRGDLKRMAQAVESALAKARRRSPQAESAVRAYTTALKQAVDGRLKEEEKKRIIDSDRSFRMTFNGGGQSSALTLKLVVKPETRAVVVKLRGAADDLDLFVGKDPLRAPELAEHVASSPSADETIVLRRDRHPPLKNGIYTVVVRQPTNSRGRVEASFSVKFLEEGEKPPFVWQHPRKVVFPSASASQEAQRILEFLKRNEHALFLRAWKNFEKTEPLAIILRVDAFSNLNPALAIDKAELLELLPRFEPMLKRYPLFRPTIYGTWGTAHMNAGQFAEGRDVLKRGLQAHPEAVDLHIRLMDLYVTGKKPAKAIEHAETVKKRGVAPPALFDLVVGRALIATGDKDKGSKLVFKASTDKGTDPTEAYLGIKVLIDSGAYREAVQACDVLQGRNKRMTNLNLEVFKAMAMSGLGKRDVAVKHLEKLIGLVPQPNQKALLKAGLEQLKQKFPE